MATFDAAALTTRIRQILEDGAGSLREITASTYESLAGESLDDSELSLRAAETPRYRVVYERVARAAETPSRPSNRQILDVELDIVVIRHVPPVANDSDSAIDAVKNAAAADHDVIAQALEWPGNVNVAGVISSMLRSTGSARVRLQYPQGGDRFQPGILETSHRFTGKVLVSPEI